MASPPSAAIDPRRPGQYTLKIGKSLAKGSVSASSSSYSRVKYNHKPNSSTGTHRTTKLTRSTSTSTNDTSASLTIRDTESASITSRYSYKGHQHRGSSSSSKSSSSSYILIFDPSTQSCTLEPVKNSYTFNLTSTPWETSKDKLERQYEQLGSASDSDKKGGELEDEDPDGEPDAGNPFDFRHYLNVNAKPSPSPSPALKPASGVHTPSLSSSRPSAPSSASKPQARPASKVDPLRQAPRKQKPASSSSEAKTESKPTPTVRLDRRASTRPGDSSLDKKTSSSTSSTSKTTSSKPPPKSDYYVHSSDSSPDATPLPAAKQIDAEESGGLEIDWGNDRPNKARKPVHSRATLDILAESGHDGPISLHSAANSPAGRMAIPRAQSKRQKEYEADVIDLGTSDAYVSDDDAGPQDEDTQMLDQDADGDDDVEPMDLGSPAHLQPQPPVESGFSAKDVLPDVPEDVVDFDEDDDLEAQMMAAMAEEGEDGGGGMESSDESEAE